MKSRNRPIPVWTCEVCHKPLKAYGLDCVGGPDDGDISFSHSEWVEQQKLEKDWKQRHPGLVNAADLDRCPPSVRWHVRHYEK